ncbi:unnamed protein product [Ascophyllum nodosum]
MEDNNSAIEQPYDPSMAAISTLPVGRGRGRGRGRGGGGTAIAGIAELDATLGRGAAPVPSAGGGKPLPPKKDGKDFRGPEGLFKKGDWTCNACGNVNWERRQTCNKCQNTKPNIVSTDEAREGHGGGFHERQDRASVGTVEVGEDGYDDFGRKKIKARADKKAKEMAALARLQRSFGSSLLGATSLAPIAKPPVPGQFDDASPDPTVTKYDDLGRPRPAGSSSDSGGRSQNGNRRDRDRDRANDREGRASDRGRDRRDREKDRDKDRDRRRDRSRSRSRSRDRSRDGGKDKSRRRRSRSRSWSRDGRR